MSLSKSRAAGALLLAVIAACGGKTQVSSPTGGAPAPTRSVAVTDGETLIRAMHAKYANRWYRTLTFTQTTTLLGNSGPNNDQYWYQALSLPGRMRVDYGNPELGNGVLTRADSTYQMAGGRVGRTMLGWNDLLILTQDVYHQPPEVTISVLRSLGILMSRVRTASFDGRTAYVVGSTSVTDSSSKQFWVERDRMLLVRVREKRGEREWSDIRIGDFIPVGNGFIAKQTYQMVNGYPRIHQQVAGPKADIALDPALFDPRQWSTVKHWSKP